MELPAPSGRHGPAALLPMISPFSAVRLSPCPSPATKDSWHAAFARRLPRSRLGSQAIVRMPAAEANPSPSSTMRPPASPGGCRREPRLAGPGTNGRHGAPCCRAAAGLPVVANASGRDRPSGRVNGPMDSVNACARVQAWSTLSMLADSRRLPLEDTPTGRSRVSLSAIASRQKSH